MSLGDHNPNDPEGSSNGFHSDMAVRRVKAVRWRIARRHLNQRHTHRLRWSLALLLAFLMLITGATGAGAMYFVSHLPSAAKFHIRYTYQNARIFDSGGHLLYNMADLSKKAGRRMVVPLQGRHDYANPCRNGANRIPLILQNATIATEDATFYKNPGFDPMSIIRAAYQDLQYGHIVSGASTITQQVVRANLLTDERTLDRKAQEVALAYEISKKFSKRQILGYYLNSVPYGNQTSGAQAAAQLYFGRPVCSIDLAQAALLAGLPRAPTDYDPVRHRAAALTRMHEVLTLMRRHGYIHSRRTIAAAMREAQVWRFSPPSAAMRYPQFVRYVVDQLQSMPAIKPKLYKGIDVYTTINPHLQDIAQNAVTKQIDGLVAKHVTDGALVSLDLRPQHYGWVLAMVGSAHYNGRAGQINMAISPRQPGSSMKPFNYIYAFQHGVGPGTTVLDEPMELPDPMDTLNHGWYNPGNYDHQFHGQITLRQALANSLNLPAVKVEYYVTGPNHVAETARRFGMTSLFKDNPGIDCNVCYAVTLGGLARGTRLIEETSAYGVFATSGMTVPPVVIWKIVQRSTGKVLYCSESCPRGIAPDPALARARQRVLDAAHAFEMTDVLADNGSRCTPVVCEFGLTSPLVLSRPSAAKTGTTNDFTDNWTVGYTPQLVTGVWVGNADRSQMVNVIGITGAAPIWNSYMESAFRVLRLPSVPFKVPPNVYRTAQCIDPTSHATVAGNLDLYVVGDRFSLCRLPDKGYLPVPCSAYPQPVPLGWQCPAAPAFYVLPNGQYAVPSNGLNGYPNSTTNGYPNTTTNGYPNGTTNGYPSTGTTNGYPSSGTTGYPPTGNVSGIP